MLCRRVLEIIVLKDYYVIEMTLHCDWRMQKCIWTWKTLDHLGATEFCADAMGKGLYCPAMQSHAICAALGSNQF